MYDSCLVQWIKLTFLTNTLQLASNWKLKRSVSEHGMCYGLCIFQILSYNALCVVCPNIFQISTLQGLSEAEKEWCIALILQHLQQVQRKRDFYNHLTCADFYLLQRERLLSLQCRPPNFYRGKMHYSFDFAQQISLPYSSQQVAPIYFLSGFKVGLFGVDVEPLCKFVLYIISESCLGGKGANAVISLSFHFIVNFSTGKEKVHFHVDNCTAWNKNNIMVQFLCSL